MHISLKWEHYLPLYNQYIPPNSRVLEIGLGNGGGHIRWQKRGCKVFAIEKFDVSTAPPGVTVFHGDVMDATFMRSCVKAMGRLDAVIDDGGHRPYQQFSAWKHLWPIISEGGVFCIEDMHVPEKLRWRFWRLFDRRNMRRLMLDFWREQHKFLRDVQQDERGPEIHMYPMIIFMRKAKFKIVCSESRWDECLPSELNVEAKASHA